MNESQQLAALIASLGIESPRLIAELHAEPERAVRVLEFALRRPGVRSPTAYGIAQFRSGFDPERLERPLAPAEPLTVAELEGALLWASKNPTPPGCLEAIEFELELARYHEDELEDARREDAKGTPRT